MLNIAVIFGGKSCEHDISVITGVLTANSLNGNKFKVFPIYVDGEGFWFTGKDLNKLSTYVNFREEKNKKVTVVVGKKDLFEIIGKKLKSIIKLDCVINCCHGFNGEDGSLAGLFKLCNIPFASPDIFCSSFAMDKSFTKLVIKGLKIPHLKHEVVKREDFERGEYAVGIECPFIVKPANLGSSIGIERVKEKSQIQGALKRAFVYDDKVIIEKMLTDFIEINCACYEGEEIVVSECERPISSADILSFSDKYCGMGKREFPAKISKEISDKIKEYTKKVYTSLGFNGIIRIDYLVADSKIYLNEINTVPGSLAYYLFANTINQYSKILEEIIIKSVKKHQNYNKNRFRYTSSVLLQTNNLKK